MAAIPGLGGGLTSQDVNITGETPGRQFRCSDEMKASAVLLTSLGTVAQTTKIFLIKFFSAFLFVYFISISHCLIRYCLCNTFPQEALALLPIYYSCSLFAARNHSRGIIMITDY